MSKKVPAAKADKKFAPNSMSKKISATRVDKRIDSNGMPRTPQRRKVVDATEELRLMVIQKDCELAKRGDPQNCVIALAAKRLMGELFEAIEVGSNITKIFTETKIIRYGTPSRLKRDIPVFDNTGQWSLEPGEITLLIPPPWIKLGARPNRMHLIKGKVQGTLQTSRARALPTRYVSRVRAN